MNNIKIIKTGINVSKILKQLDQYPNDWEGQKKVDNTGSLLTRGYEDLPVGVLQLVMGAIRSREEHAEDSELTVQTPAYRHHTEIIGFLKRHFKKFDRCGFLSLAPGGEVGQHIDEGKYYQTRDRYHLAIKGKYKYTVGGESVIVEPGTLLWFNNKLMHGTEVIGDEVRVTFVFDVPHSKNRRI